MLDILEQNFAKQIKIYTFEHSNNLNVYVVHT
jgi:hypothetical protein